jgi:uncharacterized protein (UPF0548 family)
VSRRSVADEDLSEVVSELSKRGVNYAEEEAPPHAVAGWHQDHVQVALGQEEPGKIAENGLASSAAELVNSYEFADPAILRAVYRYPDDLVGRNMLLVGRFLVLRFAMGVRITEAHDEVREGEHRIGWSYQTLEGHLEQGKLTYEIAKDMASGAVEFRIHAYSRRSRIRNPLVALGFRLFGRRTQVRFYAHALERMARTMQAPPAPPQPHADGIVRAPGDRPPFGGDPVTIRFLHPGR